MSRTGREDVRTPTGRKKRVPIGTQRLQLDASHLIPAGKHGRWVNDDPGRLQSKLEEGYQFVVDADAHIGEGAENERDLLTTKVRKRVGTRANGADRMGYLMVIDKDLVQEDRQAMEDDRKSMENAMRRGAGETGGMGTDGRYIPEEGITIEHRHKKGA